MNGALPLVAAAFLIAATTMAIVWWVSERIRNAGIVDVAWSAIFAILALVYGLLGSGAPVQRLAGAGLMVGWSLRLTIHLWRRNIGHLEVEDARYARLREEWGARASRKMFWFFQFQGVTNVVLSLPILLVCMNRQAELSAVQWAGVAVWVVALGGESLADAQLRRFKADPANKGHVLKSGLWRYSRHPNYFFEWLIWTAFFLLALPAPWGWVTIYAPLLMLWFLYKVTGIPATEEHAVRSKGEEYRRYQRTTSPFIPWFPRDRGEAG